MEKIKKIFISSICLLTLIPLTSCEKKIVVNNVFVYLVHDTCYNYGRIGILVNGEPVVSVENYYQWQSVFVGEYSEEVVAVPNDGYKFVKWSDDLVTVNRKDLATNDNDDGQLVFYAYFEVNNE